MSKSIRAKIMLFLVGLLMTILICQIGFSLFFSKRYYTNLKISEVEALFYDLREHYSDDLNVIQGITQKAENTLNINVQIYRGNELVYGNRGLGILPLEPAFLGGERLYSLEPKATIMELAGMQQAAHLPQFDFNNILLTGKFEYGGEYCYVRITTSVEAIDASVEALTRVNTLIAAVVLCIGVAGSFVFAKRFSKPIQNIREVARNVALLNFDVRADESSSTLELRDLSGSINAMADKLKVLISDLQASNDKLQADVDHQMRLDKMRREFVANVSHELKTPLHLLLMYSENLKSNIEGIDKDYYCDTIIEETNRLNDMVKSPLDLSAIENGLSKMYLKRLDLSSLCGHIVSKMAALFEGLSVTVNVEESIDINGDSHYLEQAMKNYIVNAVSHTAAQGRISIDLRRLDGSAMFSVSNEGNRIEEEDLPRIWESFYKTDQARTRNEELHSGLGLYIVKTIVQAHGGDYGVKNEENGVTFWFSLPATERVEKKLFPSQ